ncbi:hypothetical protein ES705_48264 [subsurface metagenome]
MSEKEMVDKFKENIMKAIVCTKYGCTQTII